MQVYSKERGGKRAYKGHVLTLTNYVQAIANILPIIPEYLPGIVFTLQS